MKKSMQFLALRMAAISVVLLSSALFAQDPAAQAAQQAIDASQQAAQQAQQAAQQASQAAQQAAQQAQQDAINASQSSSLPARPPMERPTMPITPSGPVPLRIAAARTVFLTNGGAAPNSPIDETAAYNQFLAGLQAWGHYTLAASPDAADLLFELREIAPLTDITGYDGQVQSYSTPAFELIIRDPKTRTKLWAIVSPILATGGHAARERWYALAVRNLVSRVKVLTATPLSTAESADLTTYPKYHGARTALIVTGVVVGVAAVATVAAHHAFENSVNNQKQQQDQFCEAHGIPLSECAGG